ncbi:MAG: hypothetical protein ACRENH_02990 [Gemmatimonadaceae bacterium]
MAALLVITPLGDFLSGVWPWRLGAVDWRFASSGLLSGFLLTPLLGALIAIVVAAAHGSERLLRIFGLATLAISVVCLLVLLAFILDALQVSSRVPAPQRRAFYDASIKAFLKYVMACVASFWLGRSAYRLGSFKTAPRPNQKRETVVIGMEGSSEPARQGRTGT